ncbi:MAG: PhoH family protein [Lachnospiraceae bacterium]
MCRPNVKFDDDIGFLPGTEAEKISPLLRPIFDNLSVLMDLNKENEKDGKKIQESVVDELFERGYIAAEAMAYMRGRSINDTYIIVDEAQNATPSQITGLITRCGTGSKIVLCGDPDQIDTTKLDKRNNGLVYASEKMKGSPFCMQVTFDEEECVRSPLAMDAAKRLIPKGNKIS